MKFIIKLTALVAVGLTGQIGFEIVRTVGSYPMSSVDGGFGDRESIALASAEAHFRGCNPVTRHIISDVLEMPMPMTQP